MAPMKQASKKKVEFSFTNWVLGGNLISVVEGREEDTKKDVRRVKHHRKAFVRNDDGSYSTIDLPDDLHYTKSGRRRRKRGGVTGIDIVINEKVDAEVEEKTNEKSHEKTDEKCNGHGHDHGQKDKEGDITGVKWCKICKVPSEFGTEDLMPEGAMKAFCKVCGKDHWVRQKVEEVERKEVKFVEEEEKSDTNDKNQKKDGIESKDKSKNEEEKVVEKKASESKSKDDESKNVIEVTIWTADQDKTILHMKADGNSWASIAAAVGFDKDSVKERFKELKRLESEIAKSKAAATSEEENDNKDSEDDFGGDFFGSGLNPSDADILAGLDELLAATPSGDEKPEVSDKKQNKQNNNGGGKKKNKKQGKNNAQAQTTTEDNAPEPNSSPVNSPKASHKDSPKTSSQTSGYAGYNFGPQFYGNLKPDAIWSKDDCDLLEHLLERYDNEKWLHMQANFYNWTGRMIAAEFIEKKFKADYGSASDEN